MAEMVVTTEAMMAAITVETMVGMTVGMMADGDGVTTLPSSTPSAEVAMVVEAMVAAVAVAVDSLPSSTPALLW